MASARKPEELFDIVSHHLPPDEPVGPDGGRPCVSNRCVMKVLWYVLAACCRWRDVPAELGCGGEIACSRLRLSEEAGIWARLHVDLLGLLRRDGELEHETAIVDSVLIRAHGGGDETGPTPADRGKPGTKQNFLVDKGGAPLAIQTAGANVSDHTQILPLVALMFPAVGGRPGRPRQAPDTVYADAGYDSEATWSLLWHLGIEPRIRSRGTAHGSGLGKVRWVVERMISWFKGLRRMRVRFDRSGAIIEAWKSLAMSVITFRLWHQDLAIAR